jgi:hypothetical protein
MSNATLTSGSGSSILSRIYFLFWLVLGAGGIFYITLAVMAPEGLRGFDLAQSQLVDDSTNQQITALSTGLADIRKSVTDTQSKEATLSTGLDSIKGELSGIKTKLDGLSSTDQGLQSRVSTLEAQMPAKAGKTQAQRVSAAQIPAKPPTVDGDVVPAQPGVEADASLEPAIAQPATAVAPMKIGPASAASTTQPAAAKPASAAHPKPYSIELGYSTSTDALQQMWQVLEDGHGAALTGLAPRAAQSGNNVRLLAGSFPTLAAAQAKCAALRQDGMACTVTPLAGSPL